MYLYSKLQSLNKDISICFIGCGKFISMFLSQYNQLQKIKIAAIVDINIERAKSNCKNSGLSQKTIDSINFTNSLDEALKKDIHYHRNQVYRNPLLLLSHCCQLHHHFLWYISKLHGG